MATQLKPRKKKLTPVQASTVARLSGGDRLYVNMVDGRPASTLWTRGGYGPRPRSVEAMINCGLLVVLRHDMAGMPYQYGLAE